MMDAQREALNHEQQRSAYDKWRIEQPHLQLYPDAAFQAGYQSGAADAHEQDAKVEKALKLAMEWAAGYPLGAEADEKASAIVYEACGEALDCENCQAGIATHETDDMVKLCNVCWTALATPPEPHKVQP